MCHAGILTNDYLVGFGELDNFRGGNLVSSFELLP